MLRRIGLRGLDPALFERPRAGLCCRSIAGSGAACSTPWTRLCETASHRSGRPRPRSGGAALARLPRRGTRHVLVAVWSIYVFHPMVHRTASSDEAVYGGAAARLTAAVAALGAVLVALGPVLPRPLKEAVNGLRGYPAWHRRAALPPEAPPFSGLAASQLGYGPFMVKQFSSPRRFASFQVVTASGEVAFQGGPPGREIPTDSLGAVRSGLGERFHPLRAPGRYRVVSDDGTSSHPFDVGPGVFDSAVRAVQRAFTTSAPSPRSTLGTPKAPGSTPATPRWRRRRDEGLGTTPVTSRSIVLDQLGALLAALSCC